METTTLVIMAAGVGSRFRAGVKQLAPVGPNGEFLMDYAIHDAIEAGFNRILFVIRPELLEDFQETIGERIKNAVAVDYAFQKVDNLPGGMFERFASRTKPWGTGQAVLACRDLIDGPFAVINADDYYGKAAFREAFADLQHPRGGEEVSMVSFTLESTLSRHGGVTRGFCRVNENGYLDEIVEVRNIVQVGGECVSEHEGKTCHLPLTARVSMNMWGMNKAFLLRLESAFQEFLENLEDGNEKAEFLLPEIMGRFLEEKTLAVKVLESKEAWFGLTYQEDKVGAVNTIAEMIADGIYPKELWN